ncbi:class I SAM-dependent methyltransferase [Candidatus Thioglobus sp.]|nr:class I SAM-dependent methyltransferase [Candidatus Thioglobus sp.]
MNMKDYLDVVYDKEKKPLSSYPEKLISHLFNVCKMRKGQSLLEPGTGMGEHLRIFKELGLKVTGLDISPKAKTNSPDLHIDILNAENVEHWPYPDNSFDIVYSKSFIEHLSQPEKYFAEAYRVLKPEGLLLTLTPDWESQFKKFYDDPTHIRPFTIVSLRDIQAMSGFKNINVKKIRQLPLTWKYPIINAVCFLLAIFVPLRSNKKILRWSRELMLLSTSKK